VASFLDAATDAFRTFAPEVPTSAGTSATSEFWRAVQQGGAIPDIPAVAYQVPERMGDLVVVDQAFVEAAHQSGKAVHVWTVNDTTDMERLVGIGVDGIISDLPTTLVRVLDDREASWDGLLG
jgi:glycerophosphoryl diester phosphodiesterase